MCDVVDYHNSVFFKLCNGMAPAQVSLQLVNRAKRGVNVHNQRCGFPSFRRMLVTSFFSDPAHVTLGITVRNAASWRVWPALVVMVHVR